MSSKRPLIVENIDVLVVDGKISKIGKNLKKTKEIKIIDGTSKYLIPGLINAHTHIPMALFKEIVDGETLQAWLQNSIWPIEAKLTPTDLYQCAKYGMLEALKSGTTLINDMYFEVDEMIKAANEMGIDMITTVTLMDVDGKLGGEKRMKNFQKALIDHKGYKFNVGIHGMYTSSPEYIKQCVKFAIDNKINLVNMHWCENTQEVKDICRIHEVKSPAAALLKYFKGKNLKLVLAHCVKVNSTNIKAMATLKATAVHNPVSNMRLGCGISPINKLLDAGVNVCMGTDGDGSSSNLNLIDNIKLACLLAKGNNEDPTLMKAYEGLKLATVNAAKGLGLEKTKGTIEVGKDADLVIINLKNGVQTHPINNAISNIVYNSTITDIETVIVKGKICIWKGEHKNINEKKLLQKINNIKERVTK